MTTLCFYLEASPGIEPGCKDLQSVSIVAAKALITDENARAIEKPSGNQWPVLAVEGHRRHIDGGSRQRVTLTKR